MDTNGGELQAYLGRQLALIEEALHRFMPAAAIRPDRLHEAMRYSVLGGGKRIRPVLLLAACEAVGGDPRKALPAACAVEMIHAYSLIHDDLPAMDNDDLRRGRPTNHKVYGEATAILAGDGLLTEAFVLLSRNDVLTDVTTADRLAIINLLATHAGTRGMVGGQMVDMEVEGSTIDLPILEYIHTHKTGALIKAAVGIGAIVGGALAQQREALQRYAAAAGLAFQIADDILDVTAMTDELGKRSGSDQQRGKATYPGFFGLAEAQQRARELNDIAIDSLQLFGEEAQPLRAIARYIIERSY
ncbi:MAG: polyprenyl synthetase family protein [Desulfuromonadales bacterium]|nr:polyprenyl synthetase family protein [Desulfuromonadales bacterium]